MTLRNNRLLLVKIAFSLIASLLLLFACVSTAQREDANIKAVYLVQGSGQLSNEDLQMHPALVHKRFDKKSVTE